MGDPRLALKRNLERLARLGYTYYVGPELEFFYLEKPEMDGSNKLKPPQPLDQDGYFDQLSSNPTADLRRDTVLNLSDMGIPVKYSHHEGAHSQHEIDLQYTDALTMADSVITAKLAIKELAQLRGLPRFLYAQALFRRERVGDAHPPVAVTKATSTPSTTRRKNTSCPALPSVLSPG